MTESSSSEWNRTFKMFSLLWSGVSHSGQLQRTMSEKNLFPALLVFVCLLSPRVNPVPVSYLVQQVMLCVLFLPTYKCGDSGIDCEKGEIGLENKKGWEGEEGARLLGIWLWHGLWCERWHRGTGSLPTAWNRGRSEGKCTQLFQGMALTESIEVLQVMVIDVLWCVWIRLCCTGVSRQKERHEWWECCMHRSAGKSFDTYTHEPFICKDLYLCMKGG